MAWHAVAIAASGRVSKQLRDGADQRWREQRLVALHVDDDRVVGEPELAGSLREAVGAGRMIGARDAARDPVSFDRRADALVVGSDDHALGAGAFRETRDANHHRIAGDVRQRLAGQPRRRVTGGDQGRERHRQRWRRPARRAP